MIQFMKFDLLKKYKLDSFSLTDAYAEEITVDDLFAKKITVCFVKQQKDKSPSTKNMDTRDSRDVYSIYSEDKIELVKYKEKNTVKNSIQYKYSAITKLVQILSKQSQNVP